MAIGTSITPRGYNIDTTGKSYTLDPAPLQRAQERNFALQRESQQGIMDTAKRGFDFMEYLGARQQLGRVKAQLGELNPNDPAFAQRYSDIILGNPLAFEHASTGPLAKMALAPVTAMATGAIEQKYKLEQIAALGQNALAVAGVKGDTSTSNALLRALYGGGGGSAGSKPDAWLKFQPGGAAATNNAAPENDVLAPGASIYSAVGTGVSNPATTTGTGGGVAPDGSLFPLPTDTPPPFSPDGSAPTGLLPDLPPETDVLQTPTTGQYTPRAPFAPAALAPIGQPDFSNIAAPPRDGSLVAATPADMADAATDSPVAQASPQTLAAARARGQLVPIPDERGDLWIPTEIGADMKLVRYLPAEKGEEREGYDQIPSKLYPNGVAQEYEYKPKIKATPSEIAKFTDDLKTILDADPDMQRLEMRRDAAKTAYDSALLKFKAIPTDAKGEGTTYYDKKQALLPDLEKLAAEANQLSGDYTRYRASRMGEVARREDPKLAEMMHRDMQVKAEDAMRKKMDEWASTQYREFLGMRPRTETDVTDSPAPEEGKPVAEPSEPASKILLARNPYVQERDKNWNEEKTFVVEEAKSIATKLGLPEDALIRAVREKDRDSISSILSAAQEKGITSPILEMRASRGTGFGGDIMPTTPTGKEMGWKRSKKVRDNLGMGHSYLDVLGFAAAEMGATAGTLPKWKFGEKLSKTKP